MKDAELLLDLLLLSLDGMQEFFREYLNNKFYFRGLNENGIYPEELYEISQHIVDNDSCYSEWGGDITSRMLCADVVDEIDSCSGQLFFKILKYQKIFNFFR
jgi:hypothetical protein